MILILGLVLYLLLLLNIINAYVGYVITSVFWFIIFILVGISLL